MTMKQNLSCTACVHANLGQKTCNKGHKYKSYLDEPYSECADYTPYKVGGKGEYNNQEKENNPEKYGMELGKETSNGQCRSGTWK